MERTLRVGTRTSPLALKQLEEVIGPLKKEFPEVTVEVVGFETTGDRDKSTPLDRVEKEDFFTDEIDRALLEGRIDCAVHSAKDLPDDLGACPSNDLWRAACHLQANQGVRPKSYPLRYFPACRQAGRPTPSRAVSGGCPKGFGGGRPSAALRTPRRNVKLRLRRRALHPATRRSKRVESHYSERLLNEGLVIAALTPSIDPDEVLVSRKGLKLAELPAGAKIGTSSLRRKEQLRKYRPDFAIADIRGNIEERLARLERGDLDGIVIAAAGLVRLGLEERITERIPPEIVRPHPLQGALAVVARKEDTELIELLGNLGRRSDE